MESQQQIPAGIGATELKPPTVQSQTCLNCGAPLTGPFCAACGQRDIPPYPSTRELVVDAFWELSGWDGRFASTVRALVHHPGMLTREFLEGRRARYLSPLRLYLLASLGYFVLAGSAEPSPWIGQGIERHQRNRYNQVPARTRRRRSERFTLGQSDAFSGRS